MRRPVEIRCLQTLGEREMEGLSGVLIDCEQGGASVSLMLPGSSSSRLWKAPRTTPWRRGTWASPNCSTATRTGRSTSTCATSKPGSRNSGPPSPCTASGRRPRRVLRSSASSLPAAASRRTKLLRCTAGEESSMPPSRGWSKPGKGRRGHAVRQVRPAPSRAARRPALPGVSSEAEAAARLKKGAYRWGFFLRCQVPVRPPDLCSSCSDSTTMPRSTLLHMS